MSHKSLGTHERRLHIRIFFLRMGHFLLTLDAIDILSPIDTMLFEKKMYQTLHKISIVSMSKKIDIFRQKICVCHHATYATKTIYI